MKITESKLRKHATCYVCNKCLEKGETAKVFSPKMSGRSLACISHSEGEICQKIREGYVNPWVIRDKVLRMGAEQ